MKPITKEMVKIFQLYKLGYDFMGYEIGNNRTHLSFHHLIVPKRECKDAGLGEGYLFWNGAILMQDTSHDYLHRIEKIDRDIFIAITKQMIAENQQERLDIHNIKKIHSLLHSFEKEYMDLRDKKDRRIIHPEYIKKRVLFDLPKK